MKPTCCVGIPFEAADSQMRSPLTLSARQVGFVAKFLDMRVQPGRWDDLSRERIELLRWTQFACHPQLTLTDHVHEFDAGESRRR